MHTDFTTTGRLTITATDGEDLRLIQALRRSMARGETILIRCPSGEIIIREHCADTEG